LLSGLSIALSPDNDEGAEKMLTEHAGHTGRKETVLATGAKLPSRLVCQRYKICDRTLALWCLDPKLNFPQPMVVNNRKYFDENALDAFDRQRTVARMEGA
jgi:hypothetical protein